MRFYLDTEYDDHNGPLISMAIIREDKRRDIYIKCANSAQSPWVQENVIPHLNKHRAKLQIHTVPERVGVSLRDFFDSEDDIEIRCDSPTDLGYFVRAFSTDEHGNYVPNPKSNIRFTVVNVDSYPTNVPGAVQHNSWWDAMVLLEHEATAYEKIEQDNEADMDRLIEAMCGTHGRSNNT